MMTLLLVLVACAIIYAPFIGGAAALASAGASIYGGIKQGRMNDRILDAREHALKTMRKIWHQGRKESLGQYRAAEQQIMANEQAGMGKFASALAGSPLLRGSMGLSAARGLRADTNRQLSQLASAKAANEYAQFMDKIDIWGKTKYDNLDLSGIGAAYGRAGAQIGNAAFGDMSISDAWNSVKGFFGGGGQSGPFPS